MLGLTLVMVGPTLAADMPDALARKLAGIDGAERGHVGRVTDGSLGRTLPGYAFYVLRFRQYPVALEPPEPLAANNLFVVRPDAVAERVADREALKVLFRSALAPVTTDAQAVDVLRAWLSLTEQLQQDGFFRFTIPANSIESASDAGTGRRVRGKAVVTRDGGNSGEIVVALTFDQTGRLATVWETSDLKPGIRPICQATKLLDPDPIVRRMAEQDLLVIGPAAGEYLEEQRARARPDLQRAIDRIWQEILTRNGGSHR